MIPVVVPMQVSADSAALDMAVSMEYVAGQYADYDGPYSFTPGDEEITVETADLHLTGNITIATVPNSYGHISYNGSVITVY